MKKSTNRLRAATPLLLLAAVVTILMSLTACKGPTLVVSADQRETVVRSNEVIRADMDGVFMGMGRYQRYRKAVADRIEEEQLRKFN